MDMSAEAPQSPPPYISLVVTSRNDNHGLNIKQRMQFFVDGWFYQARKFNLPSEIVFVEWNPPGDRPRLIDELRWPVERGPCRLRLIEVPPELHQTFNVADRLPLFQFIAKNVGIQRARGEYVLTSNIDILFSDEMMSFLAERRLSPDRIYRNDRIDVPAELPDQGSISEALTAAANSPIRLNGQGWSFDLRTGGIFSIAMSRPGMVAMHAVEYVKLTSQAAPAILSAILLAARILFSASSLPARQRKNLAFRVLKTALFEAAYIAQFVRSRLVHEWRRLSLQVRAHTNACGDFELMARDKWLAMRGYPEYQGYSMHLDSLLLLGAVATGLVKEEILPYPMRHFHIEHSAGSGFTPEGELKLYEGLARRGIPFLLWDEVEHMVETLRHSQGRHNFNGEAWGLAPFELKETILKETV
jgi:hypothetical protein